jgi:hypothetical protein
MLLVIVAAINLCGFIVWLRLMDRIHTAPRQPLVATQQVVPLEYKGTTRFIRQIDDRILRWGDGPWPLVVIFGEIGAFVWLGFSKRRQISL